MCGIAGFISCDSNDVYQERLKAMTDIIAHRGPDGDGHWISANGKVGLAHRRLSIIDLSHEADQPMHYMDRYSIVFNGEIYNYLELKEILMQHGYQFSTSSDTEVLMAMYDKYGENCLSHLDGMFSFVIYDARKNEIFAARDRFGEKPFFYSYVAGKHFIFGSEMKCIWASGVAKQLSNKMIYNYLTHGFLENAANLSETFYEKCERLEHGHFIKLSISDMTLQIEKYYSIDWQNIDHDITEAQAIEKFRSLFYTSVSRRLRSDVTVGSSLSGGLDSSLVVAVIDNLKAGTDQKQDTFSAVFPGFKKDERKYMDHVIARTNVSPHFITPDEKGMIADMDKLCWHQEEPFGSASIYVQYCVMKLAKENNVTVLLDGQGADEILAGYHGYYPVYFKELKRKNKALYKKEVASYLDMHQHSEINVNLRTSFVQRVKFAAGEQLPMIRKLYHKIKGNTSSFFHDDFFDAYNKDIFKGKEHFSGLNEKLHDSTFNHGLQELLRYADRNSMAHSREVRLPFLFHELVEFLFSLPPHMKINTGWTKWIMRQSFQDELPKEIGWRKDKIGYEPPQKSWMDEKPMQEKLNHAKDVLINNNIITKNIFQSSLNSDMATNWKLLMAAEMMK